MVSLSSSIVWQVIQEYKGFQLFFVVLMGLFAYISYYLARRGKVWQIRPLEAFELIDEGVGRAAEMGRPILCVTGISDLGDANTLAGLTIYGEVTQRGAEIGVRTSTICADTSVVAAAEMISRQAYSVAGKPEMYQPGKYVKWFGGDQFVYAIGAAGDILLEKPAFVAQVGYFLSDVIVVGETGSRVGAMQIGGTTDQSGLPLMGICCDALLIGEELFAASATISKDARTMATLAGEDWLKVIMLTLMIIGVLAWAAGSQYIWELMGM